MNQQNPPKRERWRASAIAFVASSSAAMGIATRKERRRFLPPHEWRRVSTPHFFMSVIRQRAILVVEDDRTLRKEISSTLREDRHFVLALAESPFALEVAQDNPFSLIILDPVLTEPGGLDFCRALRAHPSTDGIPILLIVTHEDQIPPLMQRVELRVSDYIKKPLNLAELRACAQALIYYGTRSRRKPSPVKAMPRSRMVTAGEEGQVLVADDLQIDVARRTVMHRNKPVELGRALLFDLLVYMVRHRGVVITRECLLREVWRYDHEIDSQTIYVHMRHLRQKLEDDPEHPQLIETVRGVGYRFKE